MPIPMPNDTRDVLGLNAEKCASRSLLLDRFANPAAKDTGNETPRKTWFRQVIERKPETHRLHSWDHYLLANGTGGTTLFAQAQSRLMVNMAGGAMENAGLCLDRFGVPYIPGSAVKGCARRAALAALRDWCEAGEAPHTVADNPLADASKRFPEPIALLAGIARAFGWCEADWKNEAKSDLAWACGPRWNELRIQARGLLGSLQAQQPLSPFPPQRNTDPAGPRGAGCGWTKDFAGSVSFLPAFPIDLGASGRFEGLPTPVPALGDLELDVVTCHHREYYGGNQEFATAPDIEEPNPVVFPAVAPGHVFAFPLLPLRPGCEPEVDHTLAWLRAGLSLFGIGAKTNAGYGWFRDVTGTIRKRLEVTALSRLEDDRRRAEAKKRAATRASLRPIPALLQRFGGMKEADLRGQINAFSTEERYWTETNEEHQLSLLHFLKVERPQIFAADRANTKSKIAKAISNLSAKFPTVGSSNP